MDWIYVTQFVSHKEDNYDVSEQIEIITCNNVDTNLNMQWFSSFKKWLI